MATMEEAMDIAKDLGQELVLQGKFSAATGGPIWGTSCRWSEDGNPEVWIQTERDFTPEEQAELPKDRGGIPIKYQVSGRPVFA